MGTYCVCGHPQLSSFGVVLYCGFAGFFSLFLVCYGSLNFWFTQGLNVGDASAFIGYTIFYTSANIWICIELRLYQIYRLQHAHRSMYEAIPSEDGSAIEAKLNDLDVSNHTTPLAGEAHTPVKAKDTAALTVSV